MGSPTLFRIGLDCIEAQCQENAFVSTNLYVKSLLNFPTQLEKNAGDPFCLTLFYSLRVSAILDHFGYPHPQLDQWQQHTCYDLGSVQDLLHCMRNRLAKGLPAVASPLRSGPLNSPLLPTSTATRPNRGSILVKASRGGGPAQDTTTTGPSTSATKTPPKTEGKKQRKKKRTIPKCTVTSETLPPAEKKPKVFSESPDFEVEGPFRDSDHTVSPPEGSPDTLQ